MHLSTSEVESEDEDVTYERRRVLSGDVGEDVLVLQDLTKVRLFAIFFRIIIREKHALMFILFCWSSFTQPY